MKMNLEESRERFLKDLKQKIVEEKFDLQRRKTYVAMLHKETITGILREKKVKNNQKLYGDHCSICLDNF